MAEQDRQPDLIIRNVRDGLTSNTVDIGISGDRILMVEKLIPVSADKELAGEGRAVSPAFVQPHIHLDKVNAAELLPPNRSGTLAEAITLLHEIKSHATVAEIAERAGRVIRQGVQSGTTFFRTHVDVDTIGGLTPLYGVMRARDEHRDLCRIEIVAFPQEGIVRDPGTAELMEEAIRLGADVVGGMPHWEHDPEASKRHIEFCMELARRNDRDVDMHVDETDDPESKTLEMLVDETERSGWGGRVVAGHCCAMAAWDDDYAASAIRRAADVGVSVVTNPATNLLLQGREDREPRRRGIPRVKELLEAGVRMACGQDCVNDAFYPFGAADQLQVALILCHAAQLSTQEEILRAFRMVTTEAAEVLRIDDYGLHPGARADIVVFEAEDILQAIRNQAPRKWVIREGHVVGSTSTQSDLYRSA